jgi:hypothetical protein
MSGRVPTFVTCAARKHLRVTGRSSVLPASMTPKGTKRLSDDIALSLRAVSVLMESELRLYLFV